jgi:L-asparaginase
MQKILIISTGGTFNKVYHPLTGALIIDKTSHAIEDIASKWGCKFELINIIGKDSLEMNNHDRLELIATISRSSYHHILIIHGTDTMDVTAEYLAEGDLEKCIVLTGAMVPYSIDPVEATANICFAYGDINTINKEGVYIAMNGIMDSYQKVRKDRNKGVFTLCEPA